MKLIVDSSILISALIKDSATREILLLPFFEFLLPEYSLEEVETKKDKISKLSGLSENEIDIVLSLILENISIIPAHIIKQLLCGSGGLRQVFSQDLLSNRVNVFRGLKLIICFLRIPNSVNMSRKSNPGMTQ